MRPTRSPRRRPAVLRMANPAIGAQTAMPAIDTILFLYSLSAGGHCFCLDVDPFVQIQFGGSTMPENKDWGPNPLRSSTLTAAQMRQRFYRNSSSRRCQRRPATPPCSSPTSTSVRQRSGGSRRAGLPCRVVEVRKAPWREVAGGGGKVRSRRGDTERSGGGEVSLTST